MTSRGILLGLAISLVMWLLVVGAVHAQEDIEDIAAEAGVEPIHLQGALNTLAEAGFSVTAREYLFPPPPPMLGNGWPIGGALGQRIYCIEGIESHHGAAMYNRTPVWNGEHAQGWLGYLPSTARSVGVIIGNRASEWAGAAYMLSHGRGREFYGVGAGIC